MISRYGFWILPICLVGLAGCTNSQNRLFNRSAGSAATIAPAPGGPSGPLLSAPGSTIGEPPPPLPPPPSDPNSTLGPINGPPKLNLSGTSSETPVSRTVASSARPEKLYNVEGSGSSKSRGSSGAVSKSSTLSKLADKANSSKQNVAAAPKSTSNAVTRLASSAKKEEVAPVEKSAPPIAEPEVAALPKPDPAPVAKPSVEPVEDALDTTLLAQPVRKGSSESEKKESKGPQSRLVPGMNRLFNDKNKPVIYPVSNPVSDEPVNLIRFS